MTAPVIATGAPPKKELFGENPPPLLVNIVVHPRHKVLFFHRPIYYQFINFALPKASLTFHCNSISSISFRS